jgi:hypothetical protein
MAVVIPFKSQRPCRSRTASSFATPPGPQRLSTPADIEVIYDWVRAENECGLDGKPRPLKSGEERLALPLSYAQEGLWFLDHVGLVGAAYNVPLRLRLSGQLNEEALERAFGELVRHHESLRTCFFVQDGTPYQQISPPSAFTLHRRDFSSANPAQRDQQLRAEMYRELLHRFDLATGPLIRVVPSLPSPHLQSS